MEFSKLIKHKVSGQNEKFAFYMNLGLESEKNRIQKSTSELIEDKKIIKVYVKGDNVPYSAFGKYYSRSFDEDKQVSPEMLKALINREGEPDFIAQKEACR